MELYSQGIFITDLGKVPPCLGSHSAFWLKLAAKCSFWGAGGDGGKKTWLREDCTSKNGIIFPLKTPLQEISNRLVLLIETQNSSTDNNHHNNDKILCIHLKLTSISPKHPCKGRCYQNFTL